MIITLSLIPLNVVDLAQIAKKDEFEFQEWQIIQRKVHASSHWCWFPKIVKLSHISA